MTTERDQRQSDLRGYITLLREARSHVMGAQSERPSEVLGEVIDRLGALESEAMIELHKMVSQGKDDD